MMAMRNEIWRRRVASMKKLAARNVDRNRAKQAGERA
jgi:heme exporter protein C